MFRIAIVSWEHEGVAAEEEILTVSILKSYVYL